MRFSILSNLAGQVGILSLLVGGMVCLLENRPAMAVSTYPQPCLAPQPTDLNQTSIALAVLQSLPHPISIEDCEQFSANAYEQVALNFQLNATPEAMVQFYQTQLPTVNYTPIEQLQIEGDWGFSLVFEPPLGLNFVPQDASKQVVLVLQGVMLSPEAINIHIRFDEIHRET